MKSNWSQRNILSDNQGQMYLVLSADVFYDTYERVIVCKVTDAATGAPLEVKINLEPSKHSMYVDCSEFFTINPSADLYTLSGTCDEGEFLIVAQTFLAIFDFPFFD